MPADVAPERQARLSKAYLKYARKYTATDKILPIRVIYLTTHPTSERLPVSLRTKGILSNNFRPIWVNPVSGTKILCFPLPPIGHQAPGIPCSLSFGRQVMHLGRMTR